MKRADDDSPERLLEQMGRLVVPVISPEREAALQARSAAGVDRMLDRVAERRYLRRGRVGGAAAAVAAAAAFALGGSWLNARNQLSPSAGSHLEAVSGEVSLAKGSGLPVSAVKPGLVLAVGDVLTTASGAHASLTLADQAAVELNAGTRLRVAAEAADGSKDERLELTQGEISFRVPKLEPGHTLSVRTPDSLVTVRGTRFSVGVERRGAEGIATRVAVSEGRVEVESHGQTLFLTRGEHWSSVSEPSPSEAAVTPEAASPTVASETPKQSRVAVVRDGAARAGRARTLASPVESARAEEAASPREAAQASTLAEENHIYEGALRFAQTGAPARSLAELETLMREHPRSPLIQSARVEHFRVLLKAGNASAAAREARRYLSEYPAGFARDEARQIVLRGLGDDD